MSAKKKIWLFVIWREGEDVFGGRCVRGRGHSLSKQADAERVYESATTECTSKELERVRRKGKMGGRVEARVPMLKKR